MPSFSRPAISMADCLSWKNLGQKTMAQPGWGAFLLVLKLEA